jgi:hypothetical protein
MTLSRESNPIRRLWNIVIAVSAVAVSIHYAAPWSETVVSRP